MLQLLCFFCYFSISLFSVEDVYLKTPNISQQNIIETTVGIRPFRKTGVRLETEWLQDKLIIHNYGYGGSGLTLCFGGAHEVLEILNNQNIPSKTVAVLGAGVVGLVTAYDLLEMGYAVHLYSDQWSPFLTSDVAAGLWTPLSFPADIPEEKKRLHQRMLEISEQRFLKNLRDDPEFSGINLIEYYRLSTTSPDPKGYPQTGEEVIIHFDNGLIKNGRRTRRLGIDGKLFMADLYAKVKNKGATLKQVHFDHLEDISNLKENIIINCLSIGSRELFNDPEFIPVRGQMIHFKQQEGLDYVLSQGIDQDNWVAFYPWSDRLTLGGLNEHGEEEPINTTEAINKIIQNAEKCLYQSYPQTLNFD